jgi:hypothetical protein
MSGASGCLLGVMPGLPAMRHECVPIRAWPMRGCRHGSRSIPTLGVIDRPTLARMRDGTFSYGLISPTHEDRMARRSSGALFSSTSGGLASLAWTVCSRHAKRSRPCQRSSDPTLGINVCTRQVHLTKFESISHHVLCASSTARRALCKAASTSAR